jgi:hypothetical protein
MYDVSTAEEERSTLGGYRDERLSKSLARSQTEVVVCMTLISDGGYVKLLLG